MTDSRHTPSEVKRLLRKESGFGCCKCGNPIVEYHHIIPWEIEKHFRVEDMMCLCPNHHDEATKGAMKEEAQRRYKNEPYNIQQGYAAGLLTINHSVPIVKMGTCNFVGIGDFISVDGYSLLALDAEENSLLISLKVYDANDSLVLELKENEWVSGDQLPWDIEASYQHLKIRHRTRDICLDLDTNNVPIQIRAKLFYKGQLFDFSPSKILFDGVVKEISMINLSYVGIKLNASTEKMLLKLLPVCLEGTEFSWQEPILIRE